MQTSSVDAKIRINIYSTKIYGVFLFKKTWGLANFYSCRLLDSPLWLEDRLADIAFGSVSASLYCTYTVQVTAMLGDMGDFFANFIFQIVCIINDISPYGGHYITSSKTWCRLPIR